MRGDSGLLQDPRWERWAAAGGILFVVLSVVWAVLYASAPGSGDSDEEIVEWYADGGNRAKIWAAAIALMFAGLAFLWFLGSIRTALRTAEGAHGRLSALAFGGGIVLTAIATLSVLPALLVLGERWRPTLARPPTSRAWTPGLCWLLRHPRTTLIVTLELP